MLDTDIATPIISHARGSAGDTVASANAYGQYFKRRTTPADTYTVPRYAMKERMLDANYYWKRLLTQAQRDRWDRYVLEAAPPDHRGRKSTLTGRILFIRHWITRHWAGVPIIWESPKPAEPRHLSPITVTMNSLTNTVYVYFNTSDPWNARDPGFLALRWGHARPTTWTNYTAPYIKLASWRAVQTSPVSVQPLIAINPTKRYFFLAIAGTQYNGLSQHRKVSAVPFP